MLKTFRYLLFVGIISAAEVVAQAAFCQQTLDLDLQNAAQLLAGKTSQTWVFERVEVVMGSSQSCTSGEEWTFSADHKVEIKICENKQLVTKTSTWSLSREGELDTIVTVGNTPYYLRVWKLSSETLMRLQTLSDSKIEPRFDREFRLQEAE